MLFVYFNFIGSLPFKGISMQTMLFVNLNFIGSLPFKANNLHALSHLHSSFGRGNI